MGWERAQFAENEHIGIYERSMVSATESVVEPGVNVSIMTYNVLAETYMSPMRYAHCPEYARRWSYRGNRIISEISLYKPDILALQEVDHYYDFFEPKLAKLGYKGIYAKRSGLRLDGCALFYNTNFELVSHQLVEYNDLVQIHKNDTYKRDNVAIIATLRPKTDDPNLASQHVIVATTHFYWDPKFAFVKREQGRLLLDRVRKVYDSESDAAVFIAGDFNSVPESDVYAAFYEDSLRLFSAYLPFGEPETHFTTHYYGCLDYIWHQPKNAHLIEVLKPVPKVLCENKCEFPSPRFPSDHLPLMAKYILT